MADQNSSPLDPTHYVEHVTRTALLLEQLARDVKALREQTDSSSRDTSTIRSTVAALEREMAVFKIDTTGKIETNKGSISSIEEKLRWLSRLVIGAVITSALGGLIALLYKMSAL